MISKISRFAKALASGIAAIWKGAASVADNILALALSPLRAVFGGRGGAPAPSFMPEVDPGELLSSLGPVAPKTPATRGQDRDAYRAVHDYLKASPAQRPDIDLACVRKDVRVTLLTMSGPEMKALYEAGPSAIKRFIGGKVHRVHGVPVATPVTALSTHALDTLVHKLQQPVHQKLIQERTSELFRAPAL